MTGYCQRCGVPLAGPFCGACGWAQPAPQAVAKPRRRRWPWIVAGVMVIWAAGTYYFYQDNERTFREARNQGVDILSSDPKTGVVTARDKKTGKIVTLDMNDVQPDAVRLPIEPYPGAAPSGMTKGGAKSFTTPDSQDKVVTYYEGELQSLGLDVAKKVSRGPGAPVTLTATGANGRNVTVVIRGACTGATVEISE